MTEALIESPDAEHGSTGGLRASAPGASHPASGHLEFGASRSPSGETIGADSVSLVRNGARWLPVMGEIHYARCAAELWRDELFKMKLGGVDIAASYVFWIHHEEVEGEFDWTGRRDLRRFARACAEAGLLMIARIGPWVHGEARNGGLPDWVIRTSASTRTNDPAYVDAARRFYGDIAAQLRGLLWKDGGPVVGVQIENEYTGPAEHLLMLKAMARDAGLDVPLYTRTGWTETSTPVPLGALLPMYGGYPDGFWDRSLEPTPDEFRANFRFSAVRADMAIATDRLGVRRPVFDPDEAAYPFLACEIGGGMAGSYHRRLRIDPLDIAALALNKLGSGSNLQGYYMYHGGANPDGAASSLQESQATGYWNDLPQKDYDFQAPIGACGQLRPHYHLLRLQHLFLRDFGSILAGMPYRPGAGVVGSEGEKLNWCIRSDGKSGFVFVANHERSRRRPLFDNVKLTVALDAETMTFPQSPIRIESGNLAIWPLRLDLGGVDLIYATAQPICRIEDEGGGEVFVFAQTPGVEAEFAFQTAHVSGSALDHGATVVRRAERTMIGRVPSGRDVALEARLPNGGCAKIVLLSAPDALRLSKARFRGRDRLILADAAPLVEDGRIRLVGDAGRVESVGVYPPCGGMVDGGPGAGDRDGIFTIIRRSAPIAASPAVEIVPLRTAPGVRPVALGSAGVAEAPTELDFDNFAARWSVTISGQLSALSRPRLRLDYIGDVARVYAGGALLLDHFYDGAPFEVSLSALDRSRAETTLTVEILAMAMDAPIHMPEAARRRLEEAGWRASLESVTIVQEHEWVIDCVCGPQFECDAGNPEPERSHRHHDS